MVSAETEVTISTARVLRLDEETAVRLVALLFNSVSFARQPWANEIWRALTDVGVGAPECDGIGEDMRAEVARYLDETDDQEHGT